MKIFQIELTDVQLNNLLTFLNRTQLSGSESPACTELLFLLEKAVNPESSKTVK